MKLHIVSVILAILFAATVQPRQDKNQSEIDPFNVPGELRTCLKGKPELELSADINPFYISGDYDGDGLTDFAVQVRRKRDKLHGLLFCFGNGKDVVLGAGGAILWQRRSGGADEQWPFDAWTLVRKGSKQLSAHGQIKNDALALILSEISEGLLYWDGHGFRWWQQQQE